VVGLAFRKSLAHIDDAAHNYKIGPTERRVKSMFWINGIGVADGAGNPLMRRSNPAPPAFGSAVL
jgi:hypothetical protein